MILLTGRNVVFGRVTKGMEFVREIEKYGSDSGLPTKVFTISDCGQLTSKLT